MLAHGLNPDYFYLLEESQFDQAPGRIACLGAEVPARAELVAYVCKCHKEPILDTSAGACSTLLGVVLGIAHSNLLLAQVVVTVTRYVERVSHTRATNLGLYDAERIPIAELFGSLEGAQALVERAWRTIHHGNAPAQLYAPVSVQQGQLFGEEVAA